MKRLMVPVALVLVVGLGSYAICAQPQQQPNQSQRGMGGGMMGRGMMGRGMMQQGTEGGMMCPMCGMMMGGMMQKTMAATDDGGVIVAFGDKLIKYDSDLNKVKEVPLELDMNQMHQKMMQMMQNCPMMQQMKQQGQDGQQTP